MDLTGEYQLAAARQQVWAALNDADVLRRCIPGCKELEQKSPSEFAAIVALKIGPVSATFKGSVNLEDIDAPNGYRIVGQGNGGVVGFAKGGATVRLADNGGGTLLSYIAKAEVGGKLASLGGRLIQSTSKKLADQFFSAFANEMQQSLVRQPDRLSRISTDPWIWGDLIWTIGARIEHQALKIIPDITVSRRYDQRLGRMTRLGRA
jgi:carbon monoxide dehydrogenase subunit G